MDLIATGETLLSYARRVQEELDPASAALRPAAIQGVVRVGPLPTTCQALPTLLVQAVSRADPGIQLRIIMPNTCMRDWHQDPSMRRWRMT